MEEVVAAEVNHLKNDHQARAEIAIYTRQCHWENEYGNVLFILLRGKDTCIILWLSPARKRKISIPWQWESPVIKETF